MLKFVKFIALTFIYQFALLVLIVMAAIGAHDIAPHMTSEIALATYVVSLFGGLAAMFAAFKQTTA